MVHSTASEAAPIPSHVPPHLVFDFDVYNAAAPDQDFHLAIKRLHGPDVPEVFWTPRQGGHWVLTRGDDIYKAFADYEHFSSTIGLTVPKSTAVGWFQAEAVSCWKSVIPSSFTPAVGSCFCA